MDSVPETPGQQTRTAVTRRITAHVRRGWPRLGEPIVRHRGRFCYVFALLPGHREPTPILRLRYQGSADCWAIGIYLASSGQYTESELPASFGPKTGTPEEGVDDTFRVAIDTTEAPVTAPLSLVTSIPYRCRTRLASPPATTGLIWESAKGSSSIAGRPTISARDAGPGPRGTSVV